jgi:hypothetical protein
MHTMIDTNLSSFSISYPDLIKLPYFAYLTQRGDMGWKEAQRQGEDRMTLKKTLLPNLSLFSSEQILVYVEVPLRAEFLNCKRGWRFNHINELEKGLN